MSEEEIRWKDSESKSLADNYCASCFKVSENNWSAFATVVDRDVVRLKCPSRDYAKGWCEGVFMFVASMRSQEAAQ